MADRHSELIDFLTEHGLAGYLATLEANKIDLDVLTQLTTEDFKEMGLPLGDRRRLMTAAAGLADRRAVAVPESDPDEQLPERRQLTILFCDMVGSTQLSGRLDPEDLGEVMQTYTDRTVQAIRRHGGHVAKIMGDGLLACFGYPHAHEDDVERALLAALHCLEANSRHPVTIGSGERIELQIRVGIHTGLVVVGKLDGIVSLGTDAIIGEAPNIAARLQAVAAPNQIVVSPQTRRLAGDRFEYEPLAAQVLKGVPVPVAPFRVLREIKARTRFAKPATAAL